MWLLKIFFLTLNKKKIKWLGFKSFFFKKKSTLEIFKKQKSNLNLSFNTVNFFFNSFYKSNKFILRFPFYLGDNSFFTELKKVKFSKGKTFEKRLRYGRLNFVFLSEIPFKAVS